MRNPILNPHHLELLVDKKHIKHIFVDVRGARGLEKLIADYFLQLVCTTIACIFYVKSSHGMGRSKGLSAVEKNPQFV